MQPFIQEVQIRWSDIDANFHLRHSVYYDMGATCRIAFFGRQGLTTKSMQSLHIGPILFREECIFRKEIRLNDQVSINLELMKAKKDFSRWSIRHTIMKSQGIVSAILTVEGAWLDTTKRKLAAPPEELVKVFTEMPKGGGFEWLS
jgi:acyl-CoA thioester hydrolase